MKEQEERDNPFDFNDERDLLDFSPPFTAASLFIS